MGKNILLIIAAFFSVHTLSAQIDDSNYKKLWFDFQVGQHIGLNKWSDVNYANDGLPRPSVTEIRGSMNLYLAGPYFGAFTDMGLGIMPAPSIRSLDLDRMPMPKSGTQYYLREVTSEYGPEKASAHFKITAGLFGDFRVADKLNIMPYLGIGGITMQGRGYELILKEEGSNIQYNTSYVWDNGNDNSSDTYMLGYFNARLNFRYKLSMKASLIFGLEYTTYFNSINFYGRYTNTFNGNIQRDVKVKGNKMNMLGLTLGVSFR